MFLNLIGLVVYGYACFYIGRAMGKADDLQEQIEIEQLRRQAAGIKRVGDLHTQTDPVQEGCYNKRERVR